MNNKYLEKIAEELNFDDHTANSLAWRATGGSMLGRIIGSPIPGVSIVGDAVGARMTLEKAIPESKKERWVGTHSFGHGLLGGTLGTLGAGAAGAGLGYLAGGEKGAMIGGVTGAIGGGIYGDKIGRKYHIQHSNDFNK